MPRPPDRRRLVRCKTCGFASPRGTAFCPYCGFAPTYVAPEVPAPSVLPDGRAYTPALPLRESLSAFGIGVGLFGALFGAAVFREGALVGLLVLVAALVIGAASAWDLLRRYRPKRMRGTLREAEQRLDAALQETRNRFDRLHALIRAAPTGPAHEAATATLHRAHRLLAARLDLLGRARFDLRTVLWKNRIDAALDDEAAGAATAHDTLERLTALRQEAETVLATLGPDAPDVYADVRGPLRDGVAALHALTARLFDESVAEAVAGVTAPLEAPSAARVEMQAALAELSAVAEASTALARADEALAADTLTRETIRLDLEADDLAAEAVRARHRVRA